MLQGIFGTLCKVFVVEHIKHVVSPVTDALTVAYQLADALAGIAGARHRELSVRRSAQGQLKERAGELIRENRRFHLALIADCPSKWQLRFISTLYDQSERFRRLSLLYLREGAVEVDEHELIMEAAFRRDEDAACDLLRTHIEQSNSRVIETLFPQRQAE